MKEFKSFIENKIISIVGPAAYMENSNFGKEIDDADIVVRINRSYESVYKYSNSIGSRTDILYSCLIEKPANAGDLNLEVFLSNDIKYICAPPESDIKGISNKNKFHSLVNVNKVLNINKKIPVRIIDHKFHTSIARMVNCRPNTGFLAIYDLLEYKPKLLKIFGFSFYLDGFIKDVKKGVKKEQGLSPEEFADKCFNSKRHVQKNMWKFAKQTLLGKDNIIVDPVLKEILNLKTLEKGLIKF